MIRKNCIGKCPKCESEIIEYGSMELDGEELYYEFTCGNCGKSGKEWYSLNYEESIIYGDDEK